MHASNISHLIKLLELTEIFLRNGHIIIQGNGSSYFPGKSKLKKDWWQGNTHDHRGCWYQTLPGEIADAQEGEGVEFKAVEIFLAW